MQRERNRKPAKANGRCIQDRQNRCQSDYIMQIMKYSSYNVDILQLCCPHITRSIQLVILSKNSFEEKSEDPN